MRPAIFLGIILASSLFIGCDKKNDAKKIEVTPLTLETYENFGPVHPNPMMRFRTLDNGEPSHIELQHILIGFLGAVENPAVERNREEAQKLAEKIYEKAKAGEDFDTLVEDYTDDKVPGHYKLANFTVGGQQPGKNKKNWVWERADMVPGFGDVGFSLEVGEIGMSEYDPKKSELGWHIIKRIK